MIDEYRSLTDKLEVPQHKSQRNARQQAGRHGIACHSNCHENGRIRLLISAEQKLNRLTQSCEDIIHNSLLGYGLWATGALYNRPARQKVYFHEPLFLILM